MKLQSKNLDNVGTAALLLTSALMVLAVLSDAVTQRATPVEMVAVGAQAKTAAASLENGTHSGG